MPRSGPFLSPASLPTRPSKGLALQTQIPDPEFPLCQDHSVGRSDLLPSQDSTGGGGREPDGNHLPGPEGLPSLPLGPHWALLSSCSSRFFSHF